MSDPIISVENLGKKYSLRHQREARYTALRDVIAAKAKSLFRRNGRSQLSAFSSQVSTEEFWALRHINVEVERGEVVGIIGRNGAGKSTLLKILSRITDPTEGRVRIRGRVASLLEVGTGFHPELTGRENIFLNGAILGMYRTEIRNRFDEIVSFAEIEKFLDTPVKHYSSGMYVRLAFAVAAHLQPEILIVDEVLAVGDAEFQKKCLGKMETVSKNEGRTVLFVSHNMGAIAQLCQRGLLLEAGGLVCDGKIQAIIAAYNASTAQRPFSVPGTVNKPTICNVQVDDAELHRGNLVVSVEYRSPWKLDPLLIGIVVQNHNGVPMFGINTQMAPELEPIASAAGVATLRVPELPLHSGLYKVNVWLGEKNDNYDIVTETAAFEFVAVDALPPGVSTDVAGNLRVKGQWSINSRD
jgi:lipopolysaccharide transport system ATP-binding protein